MGRKKLNKFEFIWKLLEGPALKSEHKFCPERKWRVDYFANNVAIEIEGAVWTFGRHNRPSGFLKDMEKYNRLSEMGILLFRIPAHQISAKWILPIISTIRRNKLHEKPKQKSEETKSE